MSYVSKRKKADQELDNISGCGRTGKTHLPKTDAQKVPLYATFENRG